MGAEYYNEPKVIFGEEQKFQMIELVGEKALLPINPELQRAALAWMADYRKTGLLCAFAGVCDSLNVRGRFCQTLLIGSSP